MNRVRTRCRAQLTADAPARQNVDTVAGRCPDDPGDGTLDLALSGNASGNGTAAEPLPAGDVRASWSVGTSGQCAVYDKSSAAWRNATILPYGAWVQAAGGAACC